MEKADQILDLKTIERILRDIIDRGVPSKVELNFDGAKFKGRITENLLRR